MKTQTIEVDDSTALVLQQRAAERGVTVPELVAELATIAVGPVEVDVAESPNWIAAGRPLKRKTSVDIERRSRKMASNMGHTRVSELAESMKLEWSDAALADIDRFVEFLNREHPSLAGVVAGEIVGKVQVLSEHPMLGRPIAGREEYRQIVLQVLRCGLRLPISLRRKTSGDAARISRERSARLKGVPVWP